MTNHRHGRLTTMKLAAGFKATPTTLTGPSWSGMPSKTHPTMCNITRAQQFNGAYFDTIDVSRRHLILETLEPSISINATPPLAVQPRPLQIFLTRSGAWNGSMKMKAPYSKVSMGMRRIHTPMTASTFSELPCRATGTLIYPGGHRSSAQANRLLCH